MSPTSSPVTTSPDAARDGRDSRWAAHRVARREELVEATLRAIRTHGPGVGMDEIAAEARTSKTVIYRHLGDRLGLYLAVCEAVDARILRDMDRAARTSTSPRAAAADLTGASALDTLRAVIDSYLRLVERDPDVYRFVVRRPQVQLPDGTDPVTGLSGRVADNLAAVFIELAHDHPVRDLIPVPAETRSEPRAHAFAWGLVGMVKESADRWLEDPHDMTREELVTHLATLAAHGLRGTMAGPNHPTDPIEPDAVRVPTARRTT